jgi:hypothetical protein
MLHAPCRVRSRASWAVDLSKSQGRTDWWRRHCSNTTTNFESNRWEMILLPTTPNASLSLSTWLPSMAGGTCVRGSASTLICRTYTLLVSVAQGPADTRRYDFTSLRRWRMKKYEYRCNRCMILEDRWLHGGVEPLCSVACSKCGGLAIRLPVSGSIDCVFFKMHETASR